jgi:hypothetical protein
LQGILIGDLALTDMGLWGQSHRVGFVGTGHGGKSDLERRLPPQEENRRCLAPK